MMMMMIRGEREREGLTWEMKREYKHPLVV